MMTLSDFVLDSSVASEVSQCFIIANQCVNTKFKSLGDLVEGGVKRVQLGIDGQIFDLEAVDNLVTQAQSMGPAVAAEADSIAAELALMVQQLNDPSMELTVDTGALANRIIELNTAVKGNVGNTENSIKDAASKVNAIVSDWDSVRNFYATSVNRWDYAEDEYGWQFGAVGAAFGEAADKAAETYAWFHNRKPGRRKGGGGAAGGSGITVKRVEQLDPYEDEVFAPGVIEEKYGVSESEILDIHHEEGAGEEALDMLQEYVNDRIEQETGVDVTPEADTSVFQEMVDTSIASQSSNMDTSRSMDYLWDPYGEQFGSASGGGGRRGVNNSSHSVMNISINTRASVQDILSDLRRVQHMDDASFFNSVS
jgi:hypothetical protein